MTASKKLLQKQKGRQTINKPNTLNNNSPFPRHVNEIVTNAAVLRWTLENTDCFSFLLTFTNIEAAPTRHQQTNNIYNNTRMKCLFATNEYRSQNAGVSANVKCIYKIQIDGHEQTDGQLYIPKVYFYGEGRGW